MAHPRGLQTFLPLHANGKRRIVELTIEGGVANIVDFVIDATEIGGGVQEEVVYKKL